MIEENSRPCLIALDWGTSSLRGCLLDEKGRVVDEVAAPQGIMRIRDGGFERVYREVVGNWIAAHGHLPVVACGMIGSRGGWVEAPYVDCPTRLDSLSDQLAAVNADPAPLYIVPGLVQHTSPGVLPDVMRGEETQVLGALTAEPDLEKDCLIVLPGTHCKWVRVRDGRLTNFSTYMTGELFAVLRDHSILGRLPNDDSADSPHAFELGLETASAAGTGSVSATLFSARSRMLEGEISASSVPDYLSGLLIGDELCSALAGNTAPPPLRLIGDPALCARYRAAFEHFGIADVPEVHDAAWSGLWRLARDAKLLIDDTNG